MWIVDRFEDELAVLENEDGVCENISRKTLPPGCREGSVLRKIEGAFVLDTALEQERRMKLSRMQDDLFC